MLNAQLKFSWKIKYGVSLTVIIILLTDLGPLLIRTAYGQTYRNQYRQSINRHFDQYHRTGRQLTLFSHRGTLWRGLDVIDANFSSPFGGVPQISTKTHPFAAAFTAKLASILFDKKEELTQQEINGLRLLNIKSLVDSERSHYYTVVDASPVFFSPELSKPTFPLDTLEDKDWESVRIDFEERTLDHQLVDNLLSLMELENSRPLTRRFLLHPKEDYDPADLPDQKIPAQNEINFSYSEFQETHNSIRFQYTASQEGFIRLSYPYFPHHQISIDGRETEFYRSAMHFILIPRSKASIMLT